MSRTVEAAGAESRPPRARPRVLWTLLALLVGLSAAEGVARAVSPHAVPRVRHLGASKMPSPNAELRFENRPGAFVSMVVYPTDSLPQKVAIRINDAGFRGAPVAPEKSSGVFRIACVGDSHTYGHGVQEEKAWPGQLGTALATAHPEREFEVLNAGVSGYDVEQSAEWLSKRVLPFAPDLVLLQLHVNDARFQREDGGGDWLLGLTSPWRDDWIGKLRRRSRAVDLIFDGIYRRHGTRVFTRTTTELYQSDHAAWSRMTAALRRMRDECRQRDVRFAIGLFPYLAWRTRGEELVSHQAFQRVKSWCAAEGIPVLDPEPDFLAQGPEGLRISVNDLHANARGYALFASELVESGEELELFAPTAGQ